MANGDTAAAAGLPTMDGTEDKRDGWDAINETRDLIIEHVTVSATAPDHHEGRVWISWV